MGQKLLRRSASAKIKAKKSAGERAGGLRCSGGGVRASRQTTVAGTCHDSRELLAVRTEVTTAEYKRATKKKYAMPTKKDGPARKRADGKNRSMRRERSMPPAPHASETFGAHTAHRLCDRTFSTSDIT